MNRRGEVGVGDGGGDEFRKKMSSKAEIWGINLHGFFCKNHVNYRTNSLRDKKKHFNLKNIRKMYKNDSC